MTLANLWYFYSLTWLCFWEENVFLYFFISLRDWIIEMNKTSASRLKIHGFLTHKKIWRKQFIEKTIPAKPNFTLFHQNLSGMRIDAVSKILHFLSNYTFHHMVIWSWQADSNRLDFVTYPQNADRRVGNLERSLQHLRGPGKVKVPSGFAKRLKPLIKHSWKQP